MILRKQLQSFFLMAMLFFTYFTVRASECYHYHTSYRYEIVEKESAQYIAKSEIDPNGVSIASQRLLPLPNVQGKLKIFIATESKNTEFLVLEDNENYYYVSTTNYSDEVVPLVKISKKENVSQFFDAFTVCIDGRWQKLKPMVYQNSIQQKEILGFPNNAKIISNFENRNYLIKDQDQVYIYYAGNGEVKHLENIKASSLQTKELNELHENYVLITDGNRFIIFSNYNFELHDMTNYLKGKGLQQPFQLNGVYSLYHSVIADINGKLWLLNRQDLRFMPNTYWHKDNPFLFQQGEYVYLDAYDIFSKAPDKKSSIDLSTVQDLSSMGSANVYPYSSGIYKDKVNYYVYADNDRKFIPIKDLTANYEFIQGVPSYMHGTSAFFDNGKVLSIYNSDKHEAVKRFTHKSPMKDLKIAYAFDNKLLIEDQLITHEANYETLEFVGSTVDVISGCDGRDGQIPVVIEYNYFFKDKNKVYYYHTNDKELTHLANIKLEDVVHVNYAVLTSLIKKNEI